LLLKHSQTLQHGHAQQVLHLLSISSLVAVEVVAEHQAAVEVLEDFAQEQV
jgi:hypothetical protein